MPAVVITTNCHRCGSVFNPTPQQASQGHNAVVSIDGIGQFPHFVCPACSEPRKFAILDAEAFPYSDTAAAAIGPAIGSAQAEIVKQDAAIAAALAGVAS
jgi:hypothetical protein